MLTGEQPEIVAVHAEPSKTGIGVNVVCYVHCCARDIFSRARVVFSTNDDHLSEKLPDSSEVEPKRQPKKPSAKIGTLAYLVSSHFASVASLSCVVVVLSHRITVPDDEEKKTLLMFRKPTDEEAQIFEQMDAYLRYMEPSHWGDDREPPTRCRCIVFNHPIADYESSMRLVKYLLRNRDDWLVNDKPTLIGFPEEVGDIRVIDIRVIAYLERREQSKCVAIHTRFFKKWSPPGRSPLSSWYIPFYHPDPINRCAIQWDDLSTALSRRSGDSSDDPKSTLLFFVMMLIEALRDVKVLDDLFALDVLCDEGVCKTMADVIRWFPVAATTEPLRVATRRADLYLRSLKTCMRMGQGPHTTCPKQTDH